MDREIIKVEKCAYYTKIYKISKVPVFYVKIFFNSLTKYKKEEQ